MMIYIGGMDSRLLSNWIWSKSQYIDFIICHYATPPDTDVCYLYVDFIFLTNRESYFLYQNLLNPLIPCPWCYNALKALSRKGSCYKLFYYLTWLSSESRKCIKRILMYLPQYIPSLLNSLYAIFFKSGTLRSFFT